MKTSCLRVKQTQQVYFSLVALWVFSVVRTPEILALYLQFSMYAYQNAMGVYYYYYY